MGPEFQLGKMKKVLEMNGNVCTLLWMYLILWNCTLKNGWNVKFYYLNFTTISKNVDLWNNKGLSLFTVNYSILLRYALFYQIGFSRLVKKGETILSLSHKATRYVIPKQVRSLKRTTWCSYSLT